MSTQFTELFNLSINHDFYDDHCRDFNFVWSSSSLSLLKKGRLLTKIINGRLYCLYESTEGGSAFKNLSGERLVIGLELRNPYFANFTDITKTATIPFYRNETTPGSIDSPVSVYLTGRSLQHTITDTTRPVTITLLDRNDHSLESEIFSSTNSHNTKSSLLARYGEGLYTIAEDYPLTDSATRYYYDEGLVRANIFGVLELLIDNSFYTTPPSLQIDFSARSETLKYYVVADNYTDAEFSQLSVTDIGFTEESRPQINFSRLATIDFTADDIDPSLLGKTDSKITVFKSQTAVNRQAIARKKIQLSRNGDVLIPNLPTPGIEKAKADMIIHVAKP